MGNTKSALQLQEENIEAISEETGCEYETGDSIMDFDLDLSQTSFVLFGLFSNEDVTSVSCSIQSLWARLAPNFDDLVKSHCSCDSLIFFPGMCVTVTANQIERLWSRFTSLDKQQKGYLTREDFLRIPELAINPLGDRIVHAFFKYVTVKRSLNIIETAVQSGIIVLPKMVSLRGPTLPMAMFLWAWTARLVKGPIMTWSTFVTLFAFWHISGPSRRRLRRTNWTTEMKSSNVSTFED